MVVAENWEDAEGTCMVGSKRDGEQLQLTVVGKGVV